MFRKFLIFALFATAAGYVFASDEVMMTQAVWPAPGDEADVQVIDVTNGFAENGFSMNNFSINGFDSGVDNEFYSDDAENVRIVSKIGADLIVENNFNLGNPGFAGRTNWSGGANLTQPYQAPAGFNIFEGQSEMPLMHAEMLEDDGGAVLAMSRSDRKKSGRDVGQKYGSVNGVAVFGDNEMFSGGGRGIFGESFGRGAGAGDFEFDVEEESAGAGAGKSGLASDRVRSWVVASGQTLRSVLQDWCDKEGWDLIWSTAREYPIQASAVFKGRFMDVSSALVRNFSRADPIPYAKFYKGNRVLVVTTTEE